MKLLYDVLTTNNATKRKLDKEMNEVSYILEIWQGYKDNGKSFGKPRTDLKNFLIFNLSPCFI